MTFIFKDYEHLHNGIQVELRVHLIGPLAEMVANFIYDPTFAKHFVNYLSSAPKFPFYDNFLCIRPFNKMGAISMRVMDYSQDSAHYELVIRLYDRLTGEDCVCNVLRVVDDCRIPPLYRGMAKHYFLNLLWSHVIVFSETSVKK